MKVRISTVAVTLALLVSSLLAAPVSAAGPIGACSSGGGNNYRSGEVAAVGAVKGVYGELYAPSNANGFGPCAPDDNSGINASAVQIGIAENAAWSTSFVTMGIMRCNSTNNGAWPAALCDGKLHAYAEQHGAAPWDYNMWVLGLVTEGQIYHMKIEYGCAGHANEYCWSTDGVLNLHFNMGSGLVPGNTGAQVSWQVETMDPGDGLGQNVSGRSSGAGRIQYKKNSDNLWYLRSVNGACDVINAQHKCVANGANGFYAYTLN